MKNILRIIFLALFVSIVLIPVNSKAITYSTWNSNLKTVAETIQKKNYVYDSAGGGADTYSGMSGSKSLTQVKTYKQWLKTSEGKKWHKKYSTNNYKLGNYCSPFGTGKSNCSDYDYLTKTEANCKKCVLVDCYKYCTSGKSALGKDGCIRTLNSGGYVKGKWYSAKNPYQTKKWCKDTVNSRKLNEKYNAYYDKVVNNNINKMSYKGMVCHNYVKYALQKSGLYYGTDFHAKRSKLSDNTCASIDITKFEIIIPEDAEYNCYTKKVSWLNKKSNGHRPTLKSLVNNGYAKRGDIISQYDGSGEHTQVYAGKSNGKIVSYGVGKKYQVNTSASYAKKYGLAKGPKFLIKSKILSTQNDTRNNHDNPEVAMIVRIKNLK